MENDRRQILDMLAEAKIQVEQAKRLLSLVSQESESAGSTQPTKDDRPSAKCLRVCVEPGEDADEDNSEGDHQGAHGTDPRRSQADRPDPKPGDRLRQRRTWEKGNQV